MNIEEEEEEEEEEGYKDVNWIQIAQNRVQACVCEHCYEPLVSMKVGYFFTKKTLHHEVCSVL
jgi:hypothetical protein